MEILKLKRLVSAILSLIISALVLTFSLVTVFAYSSDDDPLVTLSYLNEVVIPKLKSELGGQAQSGSQTESGAAASQSASSTYEVVELEIGQKLIAKSGIELIVRPGSIVTASTPFDDQGIADITNGNELLNGDEIPINAYCVIPRADGRGIYVNSEKAYIMIRGEYSIG